MPILDGEGLDSWLEAMSRRNGLTFSTFLRVLGLSRHYLTRLLVSDLPSPCCASWRSAPVFQPAVLIRP